MRPLSSTTFAGGATDLAVVRADERRVLVAQHAAIQHEHGDSLFVSLRDGRGEGRGFLGRSHDQAYARLHKLLDLRALSERVVLRVFKDELQLGMLGAGRRDIGVHLGAPGFTEVGLAHADDPFLGLGRVSGRGASDAEPESRDKKDGF
jgi:hypothetical protein